ncbi:S8/S53 family peptidase [Reticulibacter mediterranei]|nr:S8/S53 family peptidase [Reticulibacter mediterranei]
MHQDMPPMENMKMNMHDTTWRDDQVMIVFHSDIPLITPDGMLNRDRLLKGLNLPWQLQQINQFLSDQLDPTAQNPVRLAFLDDRDLPAPDPSKERPSVNEIDSDESSQLYQGVYLFGLKDAIKKDFATIQTSVHGFFHLIKEPVQGHSKDQNNRALVPTVVNTLNKGVVGLNKEGVHIAFAAPTWLCGGTQITQGCPVSPPAPVDSNCSDWHIEVPELDQHPELKESKGDDVKVFILDALPEPVFIANAVQNAGNTNGLLHAVQETVTFDYSLMSGVQGVFLMQHSNAAGVGKDVYGERYPILLPDHGLFIAGTVRDIACNADIECIRVLNDLCVGDMQTLTAALCKIYQRLLEKNPDTNERGDLFGKSVVINLSLVIPTEDEAMSSGIEVATTDPGSPNAGFDNILREGVWQILRSLAEAKDADVVIVASAGNEGDGREMAMSSPMLRPRALYPAALSDSIENIIAVGAVTKTGDAASYSCYPGSHGIGAWGGELPDPSKGEVVPPKSTDVGSDHPKVTFNDALIGIYSNVVYPPLSAAPASPPEQYYTPPNQSGWAYWIGTSFATPIVSAAVARVLQWKKQTGSSESVYKLLANLIPADQRVQWANVVPNGETIEGFRLRATQDCRHRVSESTSGD